MRTTRKEHAHHITFKSINPKMIFYLRATFMVLTPLAVCTFTT